MHHRVVILLQPLLDRVVVHKPAGVLGKKWAMIEDAREQRRARGRAVRTTCSMVSPKLVRQIG